MTVLVCPICAAQVRSDNITHVHDAAEIAEAIRIADALGLTPCSKYGAAPPAAPSPSSSTPPAPDLPQEKEDQWVPSARFPCTGSGTVAIDRQGVYWSIVTPVDGECGICHQRVRIDVNGRCVTHPRTAAQRPPDPAAPDLRDIARDARWVLTGHAVSEEARLDLLARIDAALDEKQVGAAPHSPEER